MEESGDHPNNQIGADEAGANVGASPLNLVLGGLDIIDSHSERLVFAATQVAGSTRACAARGDAAMFDMLRAYYALAAEAATGAGGRFIKPIGDGVLMTFPLDRAAAAIQALRSFQERAGELWRGFDERCRVQVKVGAGTVLGAGPSRLTTEPGGRYESREQQRFEILTGGAGEQ